MIRQHEKWLDKAYDDLEFGRVGLETGHFSQVCFLAEQCIEKCFKAVIVSRDEVYEKTHNLMRLINSVPELAGDLSGLKEGIKFVDSFYIPTRYPDALPGSFAKGIPCRDDACRALDIAQKVFEIVRAKLGDGA